jgi:hypothetical protein
MRNLFYAAALAAICTLFSAGAEAQVAGRLIVNQLSGKCLDVPGISNYTPGTPLQLYDCESNRVDFSGKPSDQFWVFGVQGNIRNSLSGMCLDISGAQSGALMTVALCNPGNPAQIWVVRPDGFIVNAATGKCIGPAAYAGLGNQTPLLHGDCEFGNPQTLQRWRY